MATHSSVLAWRIPGMGEPGGLRLWGRTESDTTEATQQQQQQQLDIRGFLGGSVVKNLSANAGDEGLIPGSERSPGEENGYPLQYRLANPMDRGAWQATVHSVTKSQIQLND